MWRRHKYPLLDRTKLSLYKVDGKYAIVPSKRIGIDTDKLSYHAVSFVWRAAVHVWKTIVLQTTSVTLSPGDIENIRKYLLGEGPFPENVGVVVTVCTDLASQVHCLFPTMLETPTTYQDYWFLVRGNQV